jgi:tetratricopeptide (TPR) repeat protein
MTCKRCSEQNNAALSYCSYCGADLKSGKRLGMITAAADQRREGDGMASRASLEKARLLEPGNHYIQLLLGLSCESQWSRSGDSQLLEQARECYSAFLKVDFYNENAHQLLIGAYQKEGRIGEARRRYAEYLEVDSDNELLVNCLKWIDIGTSLNLTRPAAVSPNAVDRHYRRMRRLADPMVIALLVGTVEFTVAGVEFILSQKQAGSQGNMLLHGLIGLGLWSVAGYLFVSRRAD